VHARSLPHAGDKPQILRPQMTTINTQHSTLPHALSFARGSHTTLETTQGQMDSFFSQLPFKCYLSEAASVGD